MSQKFIPVTDAFFVSPQLSAEDIRSAAADGFTLIVNNRPDGETPGQPTGAHLEQVAREAGLAYVHLPVGSSGVTPGHLDGLKSAIAEAKAGKTLAFCKSGMRSLIVWSYAEAVSGAPAATIIERAAGAGYDITGHAPALAMLGEAQNTPQAG